MISVKHAIIRSLPWIQVQQDNTLNHNMPDKLYVDVYTILTLHVLTL
jgi:hypothetical protein